MSETATDLNIELGGAKATRDQWLACRQELWPKVSEADHRAEMKSIVKDPGQCILLARMGDDVIGFAECSIRGYAEGAETNRVGYLEGWYVKPDHRRKGIASALLQRFEQWAYGLGCIEVASDTEVHRTESQAAHEANGYREVERVVLYVKRLKK